MARVRTYFPITNWNFPAQACLSDLRAVHVGTQQPALPALHTAEVISILARLNSPFSSSYLKLPSHHLKAEKHERESLSDLETQRAYSSLCGSCPTDSLGLDLCLLYHHFSLPPTLTPALNTTLHVYVCSKFYMSES